MLDFTWDYFDRLIEGYAAASAFVSPLPELELKIAQACSSMLASRGSIADLTALLTSRAAFAEEIPRKIAWASQHIFGRRAWCVGQRVIQRSGEEIRICPAPILQLQLLGHMPIEKPIEVSPDMCRGAGYAVGERIDAMMASPAEGEIIIVKGCSYSQAKRVSPNLWVNADKESLFVEGSRFMMNVRAPRKSIASLLLARDVIKRAFPHLRVRAVFIIINDPECSWHFQAHDLENAQWSAIDNPRVELDQYPLAASFKLFKEAFASEGDVFAAIPVWAGDNWLMATPADRPSRSLMLLNELWTRQVNKPDKLLSVKGAELAAAVQERFGVAYPKDLWRHDLEDCLERGRFIKRATDRESSFALLPKGVARLMALKQKFSMNVPQVPAMVIHHVARQAKLWAVAPVG